MDGIISYKHNKKYRLKTDTLSRIQAGVLLTSDNIIHSSLGDLPKLETKKISFLVQSHIQGTQVKIELTFHVSSDEISEISATLIENQDNFNEVHLKYYTLELIDEIIGGEHNNSLKSYTVRTYSKILNSHPIREEILINSEYKFLIKPYPWTSKQEPMTEQIVMYDIEVQAVNIEHARSLAYNYSLNINSYLSVLLDVGFEMLTSEFRVFTIKNQEEFNFSLNRYRTGFIDYELGLIVKDNHYGLKSLNDIDHINSFQSGKTALNFVMPKKDGGFDFLGSMIYDTNSNDGFLDSLFSQHKIKKKKTAHKSKPKNIPINDQPHYPVNEIEIPSDIRKYFNGIISMETNAKAAFEACCRMYNISLTLGRNNATLDKSYKVCAIEALSKFEKIDFSKFMVKYSNDSFDKTVSDYFYTVRSSHFHAGKFYFDEYNMNMQREISLSFKEKTKDYINFNYYIRFAIISWVKKFIIKYND